MFDEGSTGSSAAFDKAFSRKFMEVGWQSLVKPFEALRRWEEFADDCLAGFPWDVDDYNNDLTLRTRLAEILPALEAEGHVAARDVLKSIGAADSRARVVLAREAFPAFSVDRWWLRRVPTYASRRFCADFRDTYGIEINARSLFDDDVVEMSRLKSTGLSIPEVMIHVRCEGLYVSSRPGLFYRSFREAFPDARGMRGLVSGWISGAIGDSKLRSGFIQR
ncbi:hypothetical protein RM844_15345 [Streptomyces sp. DSM 44915]|uniref:Uncharacterized protein n=1 Tax=Streptomyces chisholmiae TaxID=3075540 RepID=A0ABU2JRP9_9ACTN|nr:hypothetical protein [Streptomyces sp. DSM 44915]MDT0267662.1 hypothetical protein [Streptomyces sp. DSM 44915]